MRRDADDRDVAVNLQPFVVWRELQHDGILPISGALVAGGNERQVRHLDRHAVAAYFGKQASSRARTAGAAHNPWRPDRPPKVRSSRM